MSELSIGRLSKFTGVSQHTIKYYEKIGLLSSNRKENSNYRSFPIDTCTDIYECVKYRNVDFSLKNLETLLKEADSRSLQDLLTKQSQDLEEQILELSRKKHLIDVYKAELEEMDHFLGQWFIAELPDYFMLRQTDMLEYENYILAHDIHDIGRRLIEDQPASKTAFCLKKDYLNGMEADYFWGIGEFVLKDDRVFDTFAKKYIGKFSSERTVKSADGSAEEGTNKCTDASAEENGNSGTRSSVKDKLIHIPSCRALVYYDKFKGPYSSNGEAAQRIRDIFGSLNKEVPGDAYGMRIKITHEEDGEEWHYIKLFVPL